MKRDAVPVRHLVYHGCDKVLVGPGVEKGIPESGWRVVRTVCGPKEGHRRAPRPEMFGTCLAEAAQRAAAKGTGEVGSERWRLPALLYDLVGARA